MGRGGEFYQVKHADDLIDAMEKHIERLQAKLSLAKRWEDFVPSRVREG